MKPTKYYSNKQEQYVSKALGGKTTIASGGAKFSAGDVIIPNVMVLECKTTTQENKKSWSIKQQWLDQLEQERLDLMLPYSALALSLDSSGERNLYVIDELLMKKLVNTLRE